MQQNLKLNLITFDHPEQVKKFNFYTEAGEGRYPLQKHEFPIGILDEFEELPEDTQNLYTDFKSDNPEGITFEVDLNHSVRFAKHYYANLLYDYFKTIADVVNYNFVKDIELWFLDTTQTHAKYNTYKKFILRVQVARITESPEILISYNGNAKVMKQNMWDEDYNTESIKYVIHKKHEYKYEYMSDALRSDSQEIYPILNKKLKADWQITIPTKRNPNKIKSYYQQIDWFRKNYIISEEFKALLPVSNSDFLSIDQKDIFSTSKGSNILEFNNNRTDINPNAGLNSSGPYKPAKDPVIKFIYICHQDDIEAAKELGRYFQGRKDDPKQKAKYKRFKGLKKYAYLSFSAKKEDHIVFKNKENPIDEIRDQIKLKKYNTSSARYLALYISPYTKNEPDKSKKHIYFQIKELLLENKITSQVVTREKILAKDFHYSLPNIAVAILAKLEGEPWHLKRVFNNELVIGVGAFKSKALNTRYIGSAFCFSGDGHFQEFQCQPASDTRMLAGSIKKAIKAFREDNPDTKRIIIHFYKKMSYKELKPIQNTLDDLGLNIPVIIVSINKTESKDYVVFDLDCPELIPNSGSVVHIGYMQYLLCNNTRYDNRMPNGIEGYPLPVKLTIRSTDDKVFEEKGTMKDIVDQVYQFSRLYWKSVSQQNLPVTIKYPEMLAEIFPHFDSRVIPQFGRKNLWFL
nr:Piwi domain-containing protein [uncultured Marinifilum sp.]